MAQQGAHTDVDRPAPLRGMPTGHQPPVLPLRLSVCLASPPTLP